MNEFEIARDELALDALAAGRLPEGDDEAFALLRALRTDLDEPTATVVPLRRRGRAGAAILAALAAAAGIVVGGVAVSDQPGQLLYAAHRVVLGGTHDSHVSEVTTLLDRAAGRLARGDRAGARRVLAQAARVLPLVPEEEREPLRARLDDLTALAAEPSPSPVPSPSADRHGGGSSPEPSRTAEPGDDHGESTSPAPEPSTTSDSHDDESATPTPSPSQSDGHDGGGSGSSGGSDG